MPSISSTGKHINLGYLILKEDELIASRIGCVHYSFYQVIFIEIRGARNEIQCLVVLIHFEVGIMCSPDRVNIILHQYADGVDTMQFLVSLS
jgi:hypothetical protein